MLEMHLHESNYSLPIYRIWLNVALTHCINGHEGPLQGRDLPFGNPSCGILLVKQHMKGTRR